MSLRRFSNFSRLKSELINGCKICANFKSLILDNNFLSAFLKDFCRPKFGDLEFQGFGEVSGH